MANAITVRRSAYGSPGVPVKSVKMPRSHATQLLLDVPSDVTVVGIPAKDCPWCMDGDEPISRVEKREYYVNKLGMPVKPADLGVVKVYDYETS